VEAFLGICIAMGLLRLPLIKHYWSKSEVLATLWFPAHMAIGQFWAILRYLHLAVSSQQKRKDEKGYDALYKVRPLMNRLTTTFSKYHCPDCYLSVDEMMIGTWRCVAFLL